MDGAASQLNALISCTLFGLCAPVCDFSFLVAYCIAKTRAGRWDLVVDSVDIVFFVGAIYSILEPAGLNEGFMI